MLPFQQDNKTKAITRITPHSQSLLRAKVTTLIHYCCINRCTLNLFVERNQRSRKQLPGTKHQSTDDPSSWPLRPNHQKWRWHRRSVSGHRHTVSGWSRRRRFWERLGEDDGQKGTILTAISRKSANTSQSCGLFEDSVAYDSPPQPPMAPALRLGWAYIRAAWPPMATMHSKGDSMHAC